MKNQIRIGISCIGSGVGQSVINSCNLSKLPLYTIGFGTNPLAYGLYECDEYAYTKSFYDKDYIDDIIQNCLKYKIDIFFPGHDDDAHVISKNISRFEENNIKVVVSGKDLLDICRDKEKMSLELNKKADIFVKSFEKESFIEAYNNKDIFLPVIAKPRAGYASKGIEIILSEEDFSLINESHIVQELAVPNSEDPQRASFDKQLAKRINPQIAEISIQVVTGQDGEIIGKMISYNKLNNGVPIEIIPYENELIWDEINKILPSLKELGLFGPLNLQGRLTDRGLKLFEMNARFTGITGLRAYMGFNEVEACIKNWLEINDESSLKLNYDKFGIRQTSDKSISLNLNPEVRFFSEKINAKKLKSKRVLLVTGATGFIGNNLIKQILTSQSDEVDIWAYTRNKEFAQEVFKDLSVDIYDYQDFKSGCLSLGNVDTLLHLGFARPHKSEVEIADSLTFTHELFTMAVKNQVSEIINISSQSVYGQATKPMWTEESKVAPTLPYSQAKLSTELLLSSLLKFNPHIKATSIRLAAVSGALPGAVIHDLPSKLVMKLFKGEDLNIIGGSQVLEFMDVRDVIDALIALLNTDSSKWAMYYNLGADNTETLSNIAETVIEVYNNKFNTSAKINYQEGGKEFQFGLNSDKFIELTNWKPKYSFKNMVQTIVDYYDENEA